MKSIPVPGCRHDVLGHNLKAIGILRALALCADTNHRDQEAEGWWDRQTACFQLRSKKYPCEDEILEFFKRHYRPTPIFSPWNTGGGLDEKQRLTLRIDRKPIAQFLWNNRNSLRRHGYRAKKHSWGNGRIKFSLQNGRPTLSVPPELDIEVTAGKRSKETFVAQWSSCVKTSFTNFLCETLSQLERIGTISKRLKDDIQAGSFQRDEFSLTVKSNDELANLTLPVGVASFLRIKTAGEEAVLTVLEKRFSLDKEMIGALKLGRECFEALQSAEDEDSKRELVENFRDRLPGEGAPAMDAVFTSRTARNGNNPVFLTRGMAGRSELFRSFWSYYLTFKESPLDLARASLVPQQGALWDKEKSPGAPFFPMQ